MLDKLLHLISPTAYITPDKYADFWNQMMLTTLQGFWSKTITTILIIIGYYLGVRRQQTFICLVCLIIASLIMFGGGLWSFFYLPEGN